MNLFQAMRNTKAIGMTDDFPSILLDILQRRDHQLGIDGVRLFGNLGELALEIEEMKTDPIACEIHYEEYIGVYVQYALTLALVSKYFYPIIEQIDTLIDKKLKTVKFE